MFLNLNLSGLNQTEMKNVCQCVQASCSQLLHTWAVARPNLRIHLFQKGKVNYNHLHKMIKRINFKKYNEK